MKITVEQAGQKLEAFFKLNPCAKLEDAEGVAALISNPWGDKTLSFLIPENEDMQGRLFDALNNSTLPEKYSAILHEDTKHLEVIWTAYRLNATSSEIADRRFEFSFNGRVHVCWFGHASQKLLDIAACAMPMTNSTATDYRNLMSYIIQRNTIDKDDGKPGSRAISVPRSFFIDLGDIPWDDADNLIIHLNAFMSYYDTKTPQVLIHEPITPKLDARDRYLHGDFPEKISGREIDINALTYWREATLSANEIMSFLTCYRIIEYLAFHFMESQTKSRIRKFLSSPHALSNIDATMRSVLEALSAKTATEEIPKTQNLIAETIDLNLLWTEIERHKGYFCKPTSFDGGYTVKGLIVEKDTFETFSNNGVRNILDRLRGIRNALSHGQDQQTRSVIRPTAHNRRIIRPWLNLIEIIAGEAMLNSDIV